MLEKHVIATGVDAKTGLPIFHSMDWKENLFDLIQECSLHDTIAPEFTGIGSYDKSTFYRRFDLSNPKTAKWGLVVHTSEAVKLEEKLAPLIEFRDGVVFRYNGENAYKWRREKKATIANPDDFPFYLLIAGSPEKIPFEFQFVLDATQSVGRIHFDDIDDYEKYAETVVKYEERKIEPPAKKLVLFSSEEDYAMKVAAGSLANPLYSELTKNTLPNNFQVTNLRSREATKDNLIKQFQVESPGKSPALLFSVCHGTGVYTQNNLQAKLQGALCCYGKRNPLTDTNRVGYITGYDIPAQFKMPGGIAFLFTCYGAGSMRDSDFARYLSDDNPYKNVFLKFQAKKDFVAHMPKKLLSDGGALAVVGHFDPAWVSRDRSASAMVERLNPFRMTLGELMMGGPVGFAAKIFNERYSSISEQLTSELEKYAKEKNFKDVDLHRFNDLWQMRNDAKNYVVIGDPAAHIML